MLDSATAYLKEEFKKKPGDNNPAMVKIDFLFVD